MKRMPAIPGAISLLIGLVSGCAQLDHFPPPGGGSGCQAAAGLCKVDIAVPAGCSSGACVTLSPDPVHVGDGTGHAKNVNLLWKLPHGYAFCDGDGIRFKQPGTQFSDGYATDDPNGGRGGNGTRKNFHWKDANTAKGKFAYGFRFHAEGCKGPAFEHDPDVVNDM